MSKMTLHTRVVVLSYYSEEAPTFATSKERERWEQALGRQVAYDLSGPEATEHTTQLVTIGLDNYPQEITASYHNKIKVERDDHGFIIYSGSAEEVLHKFIDKLRTPYTTFTIGAVLHSDGKWGFHS